MDRRPLTAVGGLAAAMVAGGLLTAGPGGGAGGEAGARAAREAAQPRAPRPAPPWRRSLVVLHRDHVVRAAPSANAQRIGSVTARRPLTHVPTALPVIARTTAAGGGTWVRVRLPGRPNGRKGWISADGTRRSHTDWRVVVRLESRTVTALYRGRAVRRFRAVIGKATTPTPRGQFFVEEKLQTPLPGGPYAIAVSARSNVYKQFAGGPGQVALHGTSRIPGALGTAISHGCVRLSPRAITWLAQHTRPGVTVTVRR